MAEQQTIEIKKELFSPAFFLLEHHMADPSIRYIYLFGGSSASKTYSLVQRIVIDCLTKGYNALITRKFSSDMEDSIYADFKAVITEEPREGGLDMRDRFDILHKKITCKDNGAYIRFRGMDEPTKIQGISRFRYVVMEEFSQYDERDNKVARKRLRGLPNQKIIYIWNPIDELMWQKTNLIDLENWVGCSMFPNVDSKTGVKDSMIAEHKISESGNAIYMRTNYLDNWYIVGHPHYPPNKDREHGGYGYRDEHVITDMEYDRLNDVDTYWVFGLGNWGRVNRGGEYYKAFEENRTLIPWSVKDFDIFLPIHISVDENVNPYLSMTIYQAEGKKSWQIDEITMKHPNNTLRALAAQFASRYAAYTKQPIFIYGDATSIKQDTKLEKGENFFKLLRSYLEHHGFKTKMRVPRSNPGQIIRGQFINQLLSKHSYEDINFKINSACTFSIRDLKYLKEAPDGKKFKEKVTEKATGIRYEKFGHLSDTMDYFICQYYKIEFQDFQKGKWSRAPKIILKKKMSERLGYY
jgi:hypothetical protein